jgi:hypothetical protein
MADSKTLLGVASLVLCTIQYIPYYKGIFEGRVRPHAVTWLIWALIAGIAFAAQLIKGGGAGAWASGYTMLLCTGVFLLSFSRGEKEIVLIDWISLAIGLMALVMWAVTNDPLNAVILAVIANTIGYVPTVRKSIAKPYQEDMRSYAISLIKWVCAIAALDSFNATNLLYPVGATVVTAAFVVMLLIRRNQLRAAA